MHTFAIRNGGFASKYNTKKKIYNNNKNKKEKKNGKKEKLIDVMKAGKVTQ